MDGPKPADSASYLPLLFVVVIGVLSILLRLYKDRSGPDAVQEEIDRKAVADAGFFDQISKEAAEAAVARAQELAEELAEDVAADSSEEELEIYTFDIPVLIADTDGQLDTEFLYLCDPDGNLYPGF